MISEALSLLHHLATSDLASSRFAVSRLACLSLLRGLVPCGSRLAASRQRLANLIALRLCSLDRTCERSAIAIAARFFRRTGCGSAGSAARRDRQAARRAVPSGLRGVFDLHDDEVRLRPTPDEVDQPVGLAAVTDAMPARIARGQRRVLDPVHAQVGARGMLLAVNPKIGLGGMLDLVHQSLGPQSCGLVYREAPPYPAPGPASPKSGGITRNRRLSARARAGRHPHCLLPFERSVVPFYRTTLVVMVTGHEDQSACTCSNPSENNTSADIRRYTTTAPLSPLEVTYR